MDNIGNYAFIDGQNLHMGTAKMEINPWKIDLGRFRVYLYKKYNVSKAYYFLGYIQEGNQKLYEEIQRTGFILMFRQHNPVMMAAQKGNVDSDIIFHIMKKIYKKEGFKKIVLVSGDGDYKLLVDFLIEEDRFERMLFPNRKFASSLYKSLGSEYYDYLESEATKDKIGLKKRKGLLR